MPVDCPKRIVKKKFKKKDTHNTQRDGNDKKLKKGENGARKPI